MEANQLQVGDIVTDLNEDYHFFGKQGRICHVCPSGAVVIRWPAFMVPSYYLHWLTREEGPRSFRLVYEGEEVLNLRKDNCWDEKALTKGRAGRMWPSHYHSVYVMKEPFQQGSECMLEGCAERAYRRSLVNIWGSVYPVDMCRAHSQEWHGRCADILPKLKPSPVQQPA